MTRFFDSSVRPPRGGWTFPINGNLVTRYSESDIVSEIRKARKNNNEFPSDGEILHEMWEYYCSREPDRCGRTSENAAVLTPSSARHLIRAEVTPELQGPPIWKFLNTLAVQWHPGMQQYFLATCDAIIVILECPTCREEWRRLLRENPPASIASKLAACQWVNTVHNQVNIRIGKQIYPYERMITEFGAPLP